LQQYMEKVKEYLPMIIGGLVALLVVMVIISDLRSTKKKPVTAVKKVVETVKQIKTKEIPVKITKTVQPVKQVLKNVTSKVIPAIQSPVSLPVSPPVKQLKQCCSKKLVNKTAAAVSLNKTFTDKGMILNKTLSVGKNKTLTTTSSTIIKKSAKVVAKSSDKGSISSATTSVKNATQGIVKQFKEVANSTLKAVKKVVKK